MASRIAWSVASSPLLATASQADHSVILPGVSLLDRFADELSKHGDIAKAARAVRIAESEGRAFFKTICGRLGKQAY